MPRKCPECNARTQRADDTCRTAGCPMFRSDRRAVTAGRCWGQWRRERLLGGAASRAGVYVVGGCALTLLHRHDIRVGIASGMFLKTFVPDRSRRIEMLTMLYPAYWRWSTRDLVIAMHERREELTAPGADAAASGASAASRPVHLCSPWTVCASGGWRATLRHMMSTPFRACPASSSKHQHSSTSFSRRIKK